MTRHPRRSTFLAGAGALFIALGLSGPVSAEPSVENGPFTAVAAADVSSVSFISSSAPLVPGGQVAFLTPGTAQARLDSLGLSTAFASSPYPGDLIVSLPGTADSMAGTDFPDYPLYVASSDPTTPSAEYGSDPYYLRAQSDASSSSADAALGTQTGGGAVFGGRARSEVSVDPETGTIVADAVSESDAFTLGPLEIGSVVSHSRTVRVPGEDPVHTTSTSVGKVTIAGQVVGLTEDGFTAGGSAVPIDATALTQQLEQAGIDVQLLRPNESADSVTSGALQITYEIAAPEAGTSSVRMVLGRTTTSIDVSSVPSSGLVSTTPTPTVGSNPSGPTFDTGVAPPQQRAPTPSARPATPNNASPAGRYVPVSMSMTMPYLVLGAAVLGAAAASAIATRRNPGVPLP